ncbi:MAG: helix-turn-helix transcriptional regulator [Planctomycetes bacterium]|nr:helix-turn-helix transcriptional regulator [Planctomycetota bacterium]
MAKTRIGDIKMRVGARVRALREAEGLSQEQLAQAAGLSRPYVGALERGEQGAGLEVLERLGRALRVSPARLLDDEVPEAPPRGRAEKLGRQVAALARSATPAQIELFGRLARTFFGRRA